MLSSLKIKTFTILIVVVVALTTSTNLIANTSAKDIEAGNTNDKILLDTIPTQKFQLVKKEIKLNKLADIIPYAISTNTQSALIYTSNQVWLLDKKTFDLQRKKLSIEERDASVEFYAACVYDDKFFVASRASRNPNQSFDNPKNYGVSIFNDSQTECFLDELLYNNHVNGDGILYGGAVSFYREPSFRTCSSDGQHLIFADYGHLAFIDLDTKVADIIDSDDGLEFSRYRLLAEGNTLWYNMDSGGQEGVFLVRRTNETQVNTLQLISNDLYEVIWFNAILRHQGKLFIGTSRGLFLFDEKNWKLKRLYFDLGSTDKEVSWLSSDSDNLWVFIDGKFYQIDIKNNKLVQYINPDNKQQKFWHGVPFANKWLLVTDDGLWSYEK